MASRRTHEDDHDEETPVAEEKTDEFGDELKARAKAQGSDDGEQEVPEQRPQAFTQPGAGTRSKTDLATKPEPAHGEAEYKAAESTEANEERATKQAKGVPNYPIGQRVEIIGDNNTGRMASVTSIIYTDDVQAMIANSGGPEARFAKVENYVIRTRDGRNEVLVEDPKNLVALEYDNGWGRGSI